MFQMTGDNRRSLNRPIIAEPMNYRRINNDLTGQVAVLDGGIDSAVGTTDVIDFDWIGEDGQTPIWEKRRPWSRRRIHQSGYIVLNLNSALIDVIDDVHDATRRMLTPSATRQNLPVRSITLLRRNRRNAHISRL